MTVSAYFTTIHAGLADQSLDLCGALERSIREYINVLDHHEVRLADETTHIGGSIQHEIPDVIGIHHHDLVGKCDGWAYQCQK